MLNINLLNTFSEKNWQDLQHIQIDWLQKIKQKFAKEPKFAHIKTIKKLHAFLIKFHDFRYKKNKLNKIMLQKN